MCLYLMDRLKEILRARLTECGWKDQMKAHCKGKENSGVVIINVTSSFFYFFFKSIWSGYRIKKTKTELQAV